MKLTGHLEANRLDQDQRQAPTACTEFSMTALQQAT